MTKKQALTLTEQRYTNLIDGSVVSNATIKGIISYYERLLYGDKTDPPKLYRHVLDPFVEEYVDDITRELSDE